MTKTIALIISSKIQWENFMAIRLSLKRAGYEIHYILLDNYEGKFPKYKQICNEKICKITVLKRPGINKGLNILFNRRYLIRYLPLFSIKVAWNSWLQENKPVLAVFGVDHIMINSYMIFICNKLGIKTAVLQDGYIPIKKVKGKLLKRIADRLRTKLKCYIPYTPLSFKSGAKYIGLIGQEVHECLEPLKNKQSRIRIVGSPRIESFARNVNQNIYNPEETNNGKMKKDIILFIHTNYGKGEQQLELQQQTTLIWLCEVINMMNEERNTLVEVILHPGIMNIGEYRKIQGRYLDTMVLSEKGIDLAKTSKQQLVFSYGSTALLDFYYAGFKCSYLLSIESRAPINLAVWEFGLPIIKSQSKLMYYISEKASSIDKYDETDLGKKVANFLPDFNSVDETTKWIVSLIEGT